MLRFVARNIRGNRFRSLAILLVAALVASLSLLATVIVRGAEKDLRANLTRMGADLLVLPWGTMTEKIEGIRLMSAPIDGWFPRAYMEKVAALEGVAEISPQRYLAGLDDSAYSPYPQMHLVAFDPVTDFTLRPWLPDGTLESLGVGDAIAGAYFEMPDGSEDMIVFGTALNLVKRLSPTETTIDNTLFVGFDTATEMITWSQQHGGELDIIPDTFSAIMVRVTPDSDPHTIAVRILEEVPGLTPLEAPNLFQTERRQMIGVLRILLATLAAIWALAIIFMGLVFSIAVNERRYEIGALRAIGFPSRMILKTLLLEGAALAFMGSLAGVLLTSLVFVTAGDQIAGLIKLPLSFPTPVGLVSFSLGGQTLALISVTLAAFIPSWRISHEDVAIAMKE